MLMLGQNKRWLLGISALAIVLSALALFTWGLKIGLDFTGGTLLEISHGTAKINKEQVIKTLTEAGLENIYTQATGERSLLIKARSIDQETHNKVNEILARGGFIEERFENVGPVLGKDLTKKAIIAIVLASIAIIFYIAYAFRNVPKPASSWRFGVIAVITLLHDVFITLGAFAILGHWSGYEVDSLFVTALLTIMGFSVHDTIVVFDRLRENLSKTVLNKPEQFEKVADNSLVQTLNRSLNTSITVILVLLSMALLGGETIRPFVVALLVGITFGTYSSIATATPLLVIWQKYSDKIKG